MADETHVLRRDGSAGLANQPLPTPPTLNRGKQNDVDAAFGGAHSDPSRSTVGTSEVDPATFDKIGTGRTPRHEFPSSKPQPSNPEDLAGWHEAGPALLG
jgi:hypothetical protein